MRFLIPLFLVAGSFGQLPLGGITASVAATPNSYTYVTSSATGASVSDAGGSTLVRLLNHNPTAGNLLVGCAIWEDLSATISSISDDVNGAWTKAGTQLNGAGTLNAYRGQCFYKLSATHTSTTPTLTLTLSRAVATFRAWDMAEYAPSGSGTAVVDGTVVYSNTASSGGVATITYGVTTGPTDLLYAGCIGVNTSCTAGTGYTARDDGTYNANTGGLQEDKLNVAAASSQTATFHDTTTDAVILGMLAFK